MTNKVIYNEYNKATGRFIPREAEVCGPVTTDPSTGEKYIQIGIADVIHNVGGTSHVTRKRPYQDLRVNFAKPGGAPQWRQVDGVSLAKDYFNAAGKSFYSFQPDPKIDEPLTPVIVPPVSQTSGTPESESALTAAADEQYRRTQSPTPPTAPPAPPATHTANAAPEPSGPPAPPRLKK